MKDCPGEELGANAVQEETRNVKRSGPEQSGECQSIWQSAIYIAASPVTSLKVNFVSIVGFHDYDELETNFVKINMCEQGRGIVFLAIAKVGVYCTLCLTNSVVMETVQSLVANDGLNEHSCKRAAVQMEWYSALAQTMVDMTAVDSNGISY